MSKPGSNRYETPQETTRLLYDSMRVARETEVIGELTAEELRFQRESLTNAGSKVNAMRGITTSARANIQTIENKIRRQKLMLWIIMIGLCCSSSLKFMICWQLDLKTS
jgi:hypothetical protein